MVRIARPTSLATWHRGRSHSSPNRSGSPNRRHFASLDPKQHADFSHSKSTSRDFCRSFQGIFLRIQSNLRCFRIASEKELFRIANDLGVCDSIRIAHRSGIARFGQLRSSVLVWVGMNREGLDFLSISDIRGLLQKSGQIHADFSCLTNIGGSLRGVCCLNSTEVPKVGIPRPGIPKSKTHTGTFPETNISKARMPKTGIPKAGIPKLGIPKMGRFRAPLIQTPLRLPLKTP